MYHIEWKNAKVTGTIRCWSFFVTADNEIHPYPPSYPRPTISVFKAIILSLRAELWRIFFSQKINIFAGRFAYGRGDTNKCHDNNRGLRSSVAMLRTLNLNAKINTCGQNPFSFGEICCSAGSKQTFLKMGTLSLDAKAYPREIKTNNMKFKNAAISLQSCY